MRRRILAVAGILVLAIILAFPLRSTVHQAVVVPIAYLLWALGLLYHALPQFVWWILTTLLTFILFGRSLFQGIQTPGRVKPSPALPRGQVEQFAEWIHKSNKGVYSRWLVANRLGKLAYQILVQRDSGRQRSIFAPLDGPDWNASSKLTDYLQAGLQGSFADYPHQNNPFSPPAKTPLDHDIREAVEFLETKIENSIR